MPQNREQRARPSMMENVRTINSAVRTLLMVGVTGCVCGMGWLGYSKYVLPGIEAQQKVATLEQDLKEATIENDKLKVSMDLLKIDRRIAQLTVNKKGVDEDGQKFLEVTFSEVDKNGMIIGSSREFTLKGHMFFVDCWVAQFQDRYVEQADPLRSASIFTFKKIYGDEMKPVDGFSLDDFSKPTGVYARTEASEFAQQIWKDFVNVCNDKDLQDELGIRAASGQANYLPPKEGQTYQITIRASGQVSLVPLKDADSL